MNKIVLALTAFVMSCTPAAATVCSSMGELAGSVMWARQLGLEEQEVMNMVTPNTQVTELTKSMIRYAFKTPVYPTQEMKDLAIRSFKQQTEHTCYGSK